jgi:hypothetical protein
MILLDPGSLAFDFPAEHGYLPIFKNLEDYINGLSEPSWHQWISYETKLLDRHGLAELFLESMEYAIHEREIHGFYGKFQAAMELFIVRAQRVVINEVDNMRSLNKTEQSTRLKLLGEALHEYSSGGGLSSKSDSYGYGRRMKETLPFSIGLVEGGKTNHFADWGFWPREHAQRRFVFPGYDSTVSEGFNAGVE